MIINNNINPYEKLQYNIKKVAKEYNLEFIKKIDLYSYYFDKNNNITYKVLHVGPIIPYFEKCIN